MRKGLLAWWRTRIMVRGVAGAALFAIPVAVAAAIGFGTSLSGVAGGLSAVTNGPDAVSTSAQTAPKGLSHTVLSLAASQASPTASGGAGPHSPLETVRGVHTEDGGTVGDPSTPSVAVGPGTPSLPLPGGGGNGGNGNSGGGANTIGDVVNNVVGGVNTVDGLLGR